MRRQSVYKISIKNSLRKLFILLIITSSHRITFAQEQNQEYFYKVKTKDNISMILFKLGFKPIYGKDGYLVKTLTLNERSKAGADLVFPGDIIKLNFGEPLAGNACHTVTAENELIATYEVGCHKLMATNANKSLEYIQRRYASVITVEQTVVTTAEAAVKPAAASESASTQVPAKVEIKTPTDYSEFTLGLMTGYSGLFGKDNSDGTTGELLSKFGPGYYFKWKQLWSDNLSTHVGSQGSQFNIEDTADSKTILGKENFLFQLNFGATYKVSSKLALSLETTMGQAPLYRGVAVDTYKVDVINRVSLGGQAEYKILDRGPLSLSAYGKYGVITYEKDSFYNAENGSYYGYGINIYHRRKNYGLVGDLGYLEESTTVRSVDFNYQFLHLMLGWVWTWSE